jgi:hypothetical protein
MAKFGKYGFVPVLYEGPYHSGVCTNIGHIVASSGGGTCLCSG